MFVAPLAGRFSDKIGSRWLMGAGLVLLSGSLLCFSTLGVDSTFWDIVPGLILGGFGMSLAMTPTTAAAMGSVPVDKAGVGSAVLNSMRQVGGSLGIALMGAIVAASMSVNPRTPRTADSSSRATTTRFTSQPRSRSSARSSRWPRSARVSHPEPEAPPALEGA